jgi:hypothetical protein
VLEYYCYVTVFGGLNPKREGNKMISTALMQKEVVIELDGEQQHRWIEPKNERQQISAKH